MIHIEHFEALAQLMYKKRIFNTFSHIDAFWCLCSRRLFENIVTKVEIAQNVQFLLLPQCFPLLVIGIPFKYVDFLFFWQIMFKVVCCRIVVWGKGLKEDVFCQLVKKWEHEGHLETEKKTQQDMEIPWNQVFYNGRCLIKN